MLKLVLIRTGATEFDAQGRIQGTLDVPLSDEGREQASLVSSDLKQQQIDTIYASPCTAAAETAEIVASACGIKTKKLDKLQNLDHGLWQGMLIDDVKTKQPKVYKQWQEQPETVCPPSGETLESARKRVQQVFSKLVKKHKDDVVGIVVSEPLASLVVQALKNDELGDLWKSGQNCQWELIPVEPAALSLPG